MIVIKIQGGVVMAVDKTGDEDVRVIVRDYDIQTAATDNEEEGIDEDGRFVQSEW